MQFALQVGVRVFRTPRASALRAHEDVDEVAVQGGDEYHLGVELLSQRVGPAAHLQFGELEHFLPHLGDLPSDL